MRTTRNGIALLCATLLAAVVMAPAAQATTTSPSTPEAAAEQTTPAKTSTAKTATMVAVGDNLIHTGVYKAAKKSNGSYNFNSLFKHVKADVKAADIAVINQETILTNGSPSGYPCFGSPTALGDAIVKAGFDVVQCATNHTMDRGTSAISTTLKFWAKNHPQIKVLGIHKSKAAARKITVVKKNGIKIAMLNYTYGTNGIPVPSGKSYLVDRLGSKAKIARDIKKAKKKADFVVVFGHCGTEYQYSPDSNQKSWTKWFAKKGVNLYVGTHPHVLEPVKYVKSGGNKMLCYYSLGNFVSSQHNIDTMLGGMAKVTFKVTAKGKKKIANYKLVPLVTHKKGSGYTVYKLSDYTNELARANGVHRQIGSSFTVGNIKRLFTRITGIKA